MAQPMEETTHQLGPCAGMTDSQIHAALMKITRWKAEGFSPDDAKQRLMSEGLTAKQANGVLQIFLCNNTLIKEGAFTGLTERQKDDAIAEAGYKIKDGIKMKRAVMELVADGLSHEQALAAIATYKSNLTEARYRGAPKLIVLGIFVTAVGTVATAASFAVATTHYRIFVGAILGGMIMVVVGIFRRFF